jgi:hypothetical protein
MTMPAPEQLEATVTAIRAVDDAVTVLVGGAGVPEPVRTLPAPRFVASAQAARTAVEAAFRAAAA